MEQQTQDHRGDRPGDSSRRPYEPPQLKVMDEKEVLKVFQVTSAGVSWWG